MILVDTPGFGDTRGPKQDAANFDMIAKFFKTRLDELHNIVFVANSTQCRLTPSQRYVLAQTLALFGKDIEVSHTAIFLNLPLRLLEQYWPYSKIRRRKQTAPYGFVARRRISITVLPQDQ